MGCACKKPVESYPNNVDWGPLFWKIFHALAEKAGVVKDSVIQSDERKYWLELLKATQMALPCTECRDHYLAYLTAHPASVFQTIPYAEFGDAIRTWLFDLHNEVNVRTGKPLFLKENLSSYRSTPTRTIWKQLEPVMLRAIQLNGVTLLAWNKWVKYYRMLGGIYGM